MISIAAALQDAVRQLTHSATPELDAELLLCHVLQCRPVYLHTWPERLLSATQKQQFTGLIQQRAKGHPVAHLLGSRGFWSLELQVTPDTLIPRPDTEILVEQALKRIQPGNTVIDLGTGSGAIALAIAVERRPLHITATDMSSAALAVAKDNAEKLGLNVHFVRSHWLAAFASGVFDVIVSNPPYIEADDPHLQQGDVRYEPLSALASGLDGLDDLHIIVGQACSTLKPGGWLLVEHGYTQSAQVKQLFSDAGLQNITAYQDLGGNDRVVEGQLPL